MPPFLQSGYMNALGNAARRGRLDGDGMHEEGDDVLDGVMMLS